MEAFARRTGCSAAVLVLTNDPAYWLPRVRADTVDAAFDIADAKELAGALQWSARAGAGTTRGREAPLQLTGAIHLRGGLIPTSAERVAPFVTYGYPCRPFRTRRTDLSRGPRCLWEGRGDGGVGRSSGRSSNDRPMSLVGSILPMKPPLASVRRPCRRNWPWPSPPADLTRSSRQSVPISSSASEANGSRAAPCAGAPLMLTVARAFPFALAIMHCSSNALQVAIPAMSSTRFCASRSMPSTMLTASMLRRRECLQTCGGASRQ